MSFGDGDLHDRVNVLEYENRQLVMVIGFMLNRLEALEYRRHAPASWGYIVRELKKAGVVVE